MADESKGSLGALIVSIEADLSQLKKGLGEAEGAVAQTEKKTEVSTKNIAKLFATVGTAVVGAFAAMITTAVKYGDEIFEVSQRTGIATETLSRLKYVAEQTESSFEAITTGLKLLNKNLYEAATGNKEVALAFEVLKVNVTDANGQLRSADSVMLDIADRFKNIQDPAIKTALAMQLFGRNGQALIPVLNLGSEGIKKMSGEADKLGLTLSGDNARAMDEFSDNLKSLQSSFTGLSLKVANAFIPALTELVNFIKTGVIPIIENLDALLNKTGSKLAAQQTQDAFANKDPVLQDAMTQLNSLYARRDEIQNAKDTSGGRGNFDPALDSINAQIDRLQALQEQRRTMAQEETQAVQDLGVIKIEAHQNELQQMRERQIQLEQERLGLKTFAAQVQDLGATIQGAFATALSSLILNGGKAKEIFAELGKTLLKALIDFVAQQIIAVTIGRAIRAAETALLATMGATVASAWAPAAAFVSLASFGANAAPASAGIAGTVALSQGLAATSGAAGFAEGTDTVPSMLSPGEMIVPRSFSDAIRAGDLSLSGGKGGGKTVTVQNTFTFENVHLSNDADINALTEALGENIERTLRRVN